MNCFQKRRAKMKYLITKVHISLSILSDDIDKNRAEIAKMFGVEECDVHLNYEEIKEGEG